MTSYLLEFNSSHHDFYGGDFQISLKIDAGESGPFHYQVSRFGLGVIGGAEESEWTNLPNAISMRLCIFLVVLGKPGAEKILDDYYAYCLFDQDRTEPKACHSIKVWADGKQVLNWVRLFDIRFGNTADLGQKMFKLLMSIAVMGWKQFEDVDSSIQEPPVKSIRQPST